MTTPQVEYIGFRNGETTRDYLLLIRHADGRCDEFVLAIEQQAFVSRRARYQDGAEICFRKLSRALAALASTPESKPLPARQDVTEAELLAYREEHAPKVRTPRPMSPAPVVR